MSDKTFSKTAVEFNKLEEAVMSTPQGRWFLKEFAERNRVIETEKVLEELAAIKSGLDHSGKEPPLSQLRGELIEMASSIAKTRSDITALKSEDGAVEPFGSAAFELDSIVEATEKATSSILTAAEELQAISETTRIDEDFGVFCDKVQKLTSEIFSACSFQDVTGQRLEKVVGTLRFLEQRVNEMIDAWGSEDGQQDAVDPVTGTVDTEEPVRFAETVEGEEQAILSEGVGTGDPVSFDDDVSGENDWDKIADESFIEELATEEAEPDKVEGFSQSEIDAMLSGDLAFGELGDPGEVEEPSVEADAFAPGIEEQVDPSFDVPSEPALEEEVGEDRLLVALREQAVRDPYADGPAEVEAVQETETQPLQSEMPEEEVSSLEDEVSEPDDRDLSWLYG